MIISLLASISRGLVDGDKVALVVDMADKGYISEINILLFKAAQSDNFNYCPRSKSET